MDTQQPDNNFSYAAHSFDDIRNHHIPPTAMVRYMPSQFSNECSESEDPMESLDNIQNAQQVIFVSLFYFAHIFLS